MRTAVWYTTATYAVVFSLWIMVSDQVVASLWTDLESVRIASYVSAWLFLAITSVLLFVVMRRQLGRVANHLADRHRAEALAAGNERIMEMIATGAPMERTLEALVYFLETQAPDMTCSVLLLDRDGQHLRNGASPHLPAAYVDAIDGAAIGPQAGSCGTAVFRGERVAVKDIATDPLWTEYRDLALPHGLRACWSTPFFDRERRVLGTFAVYYTTPRLPDEREIKLVDLAAHSAAVCVSRHRSDAALRESETRFRTLVDQASDAYYVCDADGRFVDVNQRACEMLGYTYSELLALSLGDVYLNLDDAVVRDVWEQARSGSKVTINSRHRRRDGTVFPVEVSVSSCTIGGEIVFLGLARDTTDRDRAEQALRESEASLREAQNRLRSALEIGGIGTFVVDFVKNETFWDDPLIRLYGRRWDPAHGAAPGPFLAFVHPDDRTRVEEDMTQSIEGSGAQQTEYRIVLPDGATRWVATTARAEHDADGRPTRLIGATVDITARKVAEENLRQAQKLEAIGQLAGGVAHDFNNILTVILAGVSFLGMEKDLSPSAREFVAEIKGAANRATNLTRQLLTFSRRQAMQLNHLELNAIVTNMSRMLQRVLGEHIRMELSLAPQDLAVFADAGMMEQVVMNLAVNARDAMPGGGRLSIGTRAVVMKPGTDAPGGAPRMGDFVCLEVGDDGHGISNSVMPHIFEPFFTTKEVGRGTGLGLATVQGIVDQHGGWVEVKSSEGAGTTFRVYLPRVDAAAVDPILRATLRPARTGSETILLVEDESVVRALVRDLLSRSGYVVLDAATGPRAIELWNEAGRDVDLLISDLIMPDGMNGFDLADRLISEKPTLRTIFMSGYSPDMAGLHGKSRENFVFLPKPFDLESLMETVRRALERPEPISVPPGRMGRRAGGATGKVHPGEVRSRR